MANSNIYRIAVLSPLPDLYDYLPPAKGPMPVIGGRVRVPFGRSRRIGVVMATASASEVPRETLKPISATLDQEPLFDEQLLALLQWASGYYQHPLGDSLATALPRQLREGQPAEVEIHGVRLRRDLAKDDLDSQRRRGARQAELLNLLEQHPDGVSRRSIARVPALSGALKRLEGKDWIETFVAEEPPQPEFSGIRVAPGPQLSDEQQAALDRITEGLQADEPLPPVLLFGVTGSGKTEVYLRAIEKCLARNRQALVLVPEIALTPQLVARFSNRFDAPLALLHSGLADGQRLQAWRAARSGQAAIVLGTRSAVFTPMLHPGLIVVDEEHDGSFKQQEGMRYNARDLAVYRARQLKVPIVLGSATPSLESIYNARTGRYDECLINARVGAAKPPLIRRLDLRTEPSTGGLTAALMEAIREHLEHGAQAMLFLNRRGYAPAWFCTGCGKIADCKSCDAHLTYHQHEHRLRCHHCGAHGNPPEHCEACGEAHTPVGQGTERLEEMLRNTFPRARIARLDRDTTRRRGALEKLINAMREREIDILVGTQMLTKGHHFPEVSLVGVINADQGLFGTDFRATERLAQLITQVAGRAGRAERPGEVLIQTAFPEHPLLERLLTEGYASFASNALAERAEAAWPPSSHLALLRARDRSQTKLFAFLNRARDLAERLTGTTQVRVLGPAASPMFKRAGQCHAQLLFQAGSRGALAALLTPLSAELRASRERLRWSLDVDPGDLF